MFGWGQKKKGIELEDLVNAVVTQVSKNLDTPNPEKDMQEARAASVTVGTAFGGAIEMSMRSNHGGYLYSILQPVEAIELIHQLAANVGCHIHIQPREDFASWREWNYSAEELAHFRGEQELPGVGHAPHTLGFNNLPKIGKQSVKQVEEKENAVATKKAVNKRSTKRSRATTK